MVHVTRNRIRAPIRRRNVTRPSRLASRYQNARRVQVRMRRPVRPAYSRRRPSRRRLW